MSDSHSANREPLAIVGIGCRLPGGVSGPESFWQMMVEKRSGIIPVPSDRWNRERWHHENVDIPGKMITKWGGFVSEFDKFDAQFFGISPREALRMDPQQRWMLETSWESLEDAGIPPSSAPPVPPSAVADVSPSTLPSPFDASSASVPAPSPPPASALQPRPAAPNITNASFPPQRMREP